MNCIERDIRASIALPELASIVYSYLRSYENALVSLIASRLDHMRIDGGYYPPRTLMFEQPVDWEGKQWIVAITDENEVWSKIPYFAVAEVEKVKYPIDAYPLYFALLRKRADELLGKKIEG
jgi:hypothetical protein